MTDFESLKTTIQTLQTEAIEGSQPEMLKSKSHNIEAVIEGLDNGSIRVINPEDGSVNAWVKHAILMYFRIRPMESYDVGPFRYVDKIPLKRNMNELGVRVVPPATARYGSFMENGVILMPSYVNIGAYIGARTMVDTWATVGSCAQIGSDVHLSGGVGIGGVLEPASASPVIIGDGAFLGSRAIVVEGVKVGKEAVLAANVTLTASTAIIDVLNDKEYRGFVPDRSVVLPGTRQKELAPGKSITIPCAYIIGQRKESTDKKTSLNNVLRDYSLSV